MLEVKFSADNTTLFIASFDSMCDMGQVHTVITTFPSKMSNLQIVYAIADPHFLLNAKLLYQAAEKERVVHALEAPALVGRNTSGMRISQSHTRTCAPMHACTHTAINTIRVDFLLFSIYLKKPCKTFNKAT